MPGERPVSIAHLNALAQQQGFKDYATYSAWNQKYRSQNQQGGQVTQQAPKNWLQQLYDYVPSPAMLIGRVSDAYGRATGETAR